MYPTAVRGCGSSTRPVSRWTSDQRSPRNSPRRMPVAAASRTASKPFSAHSSSRALPDPRRTGRLQRGALRRMGARVVPHGPGRRSHRNAPGQRRPVPHDAPPTATCTSHGDVRRPARRSETNPTVGRTWPASGSVDPSIAWVTTGPPLPRPLDQNDGNACASTAPVRSASGALRSLERPGPASGVPGHGASSSTPIASSALPGRRQGSGPVRDVRGRSPADRSSSRGGGCPREPRLHVRWSRSGPKNEGHPGVGKRSPAAITTKQANPGNSLVRWYFWPAVRTDPATRSEDGHSIRLRSASAARGAPSSRVVHP